MTPEERQEIMRRLAAGEELSPEWARALLPPEKREYELVYHGKEREENIIAETLAVRLQAVRTFGKNGGGECKRGQAATIDKAGQGEKVWGSLSVPRISIVESRSLTPFVCTSFGLFPTARTTGRLPENTTSARDREYQPLAFFRPTLHLSTDS